MPIASLSSQRIAVKRVYAPSSRGDGKRVLVDRLWPRGLSKERAAVHAWLKELAPSDRLRQWFHAKSDYPKSDRTQLDQWAAFRKLYLKELRRPEVSEALDELYRLANQRSKLTLLFASKNEEHNNAIVLKDLLDGMRKPPTGTGPGAARAMRDRQAKRMIIRS